MAFDAVAGAVHLIIPGQAGTGLRELSGKDRDLGSRLRADDTFF
jgi:hypothetical protein